MTFHGNGEEVSILQVLHLPAVCRDVGHVRDDSGDACLLDRTVNLRRASDALSRWIQVGEFCRIDLPDALDRRVKFFCTMVGRAPERILQDECVDQRINRMDIMEGFFQRHDSTSHRTMAAMPGAIQPAAAEMRKRKGINKEPCTRDCGSPGILITGPDPRSRQNVQNLPSAL